MAQKYRLIYCAKIDDEKHSGMLKIGDTEFIPTKPINSYLPNEDSLRKEANARIQAWSGTAAAGAQLVYCEALIRYNNQTQNFETYRDNTVHTILQHSGFPKVDFDSALDSGKEWFSVDLDTVIAAIKASKEYRDYLDTSELPEKEIYKLRVEQQQAVNDTILRFRKNDNMLWHAKMRFGKTITALNLIKETPSFKRTIIITHRPVVEDSWGSDFYHVFSKSDKYVFLTKIQDADFILNDDVTDEAKDRANDARLAQLVADGINFVYFASIQDLRGSKRVGGRFEKNNIVFDINWDLVIIDEAHEGTMTELGQKVINLLIKENTKKLDLSGTAYNLFDQYAEKGSVFTWDYVMEQEAKRNWFINHPGEKNPYADMPVMHIYTFDLENAIKEYGVSLVGKTFSFREFFRTWTGSLSKDGQPVPAGKSIGDFVHPEAVRRFLDLLTIGDESSRFPYVSRKKCTQNAHSLWMVPGVKEAAALSKLLREHPLFGQEKLFGIANVAGEGDHDEEKNYHNALEHVRKTIANHPNSITLSCGRLTTGVTVKEWTSVFMLSGSETTDAKNYMQTIFRVQSAGKINGVQKTDAYVYDFAPDRTLLVIAESVLGSKRGRHGVAVSDDDRKKAFSEFLNFCPVVAIDGAEFKPFGVEALVSQINRVQIDRALRTGFMDNSIYDMSKFKTLSKVDIEKLNAIFKKLKETGAKGQLTSAGLAKNGTKKGKGSTKDHGKPSGEKKRDAEKKQKDLEKNILERLRTISIRIPLLFYGGNFELEEGRLAEVITGIDKASWDVFMPANLTKADFRTLVKYYNQETVIGAAKIIRSKAQEADKLPPTERVIAIADIFSHFHNPSKETVLTPWRVVNMHLSDTLGGWCFYNEQFEENTDEYYKRLAEPRFVDHGEVTSKTVSNADAVILELNSKSGLYPLYVTYCIYRAKLGEKMESEFLPEELQKIWDDAVSQVYVLCQTQMAASITLRTLLGFRASRANIKYDVKLLDDMKADVEKTAKKIIRGSYWGNEVKTMKFDAVVGNPPYQTITNGGVDTGRAAKQAAPIFNLFVEQAKKLNPNYLSMIIPARWYNGGMGLGPFRSDMLNDTHLSKLVDFVNSKDCFTTVDIGGGLCYFLWDRDHTSDCSVVNKSGDNRDEMCRSLNQFGNMFVRSNKAISIIQKIQEKTDTFVSEMVSPIDTFGIPSKVRGQKEPFDGAILLVHSDGSNSTKTSYIERTTVTKNEHLIDKYKIRISILVPQNGEAGVRPERGYRSISTPHIVYPGQVDSFSYLNIGFFDTEQEAENFRSYMMCKFPRFMLRTTYSSAHISQNNFVFVPMMDFNRKWTDGDLYTYFSLSEDEIRLIEETMRPMDFDEL